MSSMLSVKLRRDLRTSWSRFVLMVIAIAVSLMVFGGVLATGTALGRETSRAYLSTEPASATIVLDKAIDPEQMAKIVAEAQTRPGVIAATGRAQFSSEITVNGQSRVNPLQVLVATPDDPMRMVKFDVQQQGSWPPSPGDIFIGRDSLTLLNAAIGDTLTIRAPSGDTARLRIAGTVYDPSLSPSSQEQTGHGYLSTATPAISGSKPILNLLKIQAADPGQTVPSRDRDTIVSVASDLSTWLKREHGLTVTEIQVPRPYSHPHQYQGDVTFLSLLGGTIAVLLLATILVAAMLNNLFTQQIPQIGIMKAVGVRSGHIGLHYLRMTLVVSAAASLLALVPSLLLARFLLGKLLGRISVEPISMAPPWWTYLVFFLVGLALPPLMALVPLIRTSRATVRAAIDYRGGGSNPSAATGILVRLSRIRGLDRRLLMALRNMIRRPARFWLSVGLLASAGTVFVAGMSLGDGIAAQATELTDQRTWDVDVQLASPVAASKATALVERLPGVSRVEGWNVTAAAIGGAGQVPVTRTYPDQGHDRIGVTAIPAGTTLFTPPPLLEGRWLNPGEKGAIVINQITRKDAVPGVHAGDTVQLSIGGAPTTWHVVGIVTERVVGNGVYTTAEGLVDATRQPPQINQLRIVTNSHDEQSRQAMARTVDSALTDAGIRVGVAASVSRYETGIAGHIGPLVTIFIFLASALGVVGAISLASTMSANVLDRTREFGVMHAIGAAPKSVRRIVTVEGVFLALTSCLVAVIPAIGLTALLGDALGNFLVSAPLPYRISAPAAGIWITLAVLGAVLAIQASAARASRITVREALAYL